MNSHASLAGLDLHSPWHYNQEPDPGAVGAGLYWFKKSTKTISRRNDANSGWTSVLASTASNALPPGTDWSGFVTAFNALTPGDTIYLANETLVQEDQLWINKDCRIIGSGPNSKIYQAANFPGGRHDNFLIGNFGTGPTSPLMGIELADFTLEHNRTSLSGGPVTRTLGIAPFNGTRSTHIRNITFVNITSDCIIVRNEEANETNPNSKGIDGIFVSGCTANEWYEAFFNIHEGGCSNVWVMNCTGNVSLAHPDTSVSRPYALEINLEEPAFPGFIQNVNFANNTFISALAGANFTDSFGLMAKCTPGVDIRYHQLYFTHNHLENFDHQFYIGAFNSGGGSPGLAYIYAFGNTFMWGSSPICLVRPFGQIGDIVQFGDNDVYYRSGQTPIAYDNAFDPSGNVTFTQSPPNRTHLV